MKPTYEEIAGAIFKDDLDRLDGLLRNGGDIQYRTDSDNWNYLHTALVSVVRAPDPSTIQHLVDLGVEVNALDNDGDSPLHFAVRLKEPELVRILLDAGADANIENRDGVTPLRAALARLPVDHEAIRLLIAAGADPDHKPEGGIKIRDLVKIVASNDEKLLQLFE